MKIVLSSAQWDELNVDNEREFVRAAFYLGMNYMYIKNRSRFRCHDRERSEVIETARSLGMTTDDDVILGKAT